MTSSTKMVSPPSKKNPIPTGMCHAGWHEGDRAKDWRGIPVRTCYHWQMCPCECHERITNMFAVAEQERVLVENPEYVSPPRTWYMPVYGVDYGEGANSSVALAGTPETLERTAPAESGPAVAVRIPTFAPTPSGKSAKGELEAYVLEVVTEWLIEHDCLCTPKFVSEEIARVQHIPTPSVGAVSAVFDRWVKYGYCEIAKNPSRFQGLTELGQVKGLPALKNEYKRKNR